MEDKGRTPGEQIEAAVNTHSAPSDLRITDLRIAVVASNYDYPIIRIDTNQDVYGIGEVRDAGHKENALQFKNVLLGQNPCNVDMIFRAIKHFGGPGREGGGVSGIEIALWDLVGKVYGVPCYQLLGGKYRDRVRIYADTPAPAEPTPQAYAERVLGRKEMGLTFIKFDVGPRILESHPNTLIGTPPQGEYALGRRWRAPGAGFGSRVTDEGIAQMAAVVDDGVHRLERVGRCVQLVQIGNARLFVGHGDPAAADVEPADTGDSRCQILGGTCLIDEVNPSSS